MIPATIPVSVGGVARDEAGKPVAGATITLYDTSLRGSRAAGQATTDSLGRYVIRDATVPVQTSFNGHPFRKEMTPYAGFILSGIAPGLGVSWSPPRSMYSVNPPHPDDIQGRLPFGHAVELDMTFPKAASLNGKIVDEDGGPIKGAKLQIADCDLLDSAGHETNHRQGYDWKVLPDHIGRAVTDRDGRFQIKGIADRGMLLALRAAPPDREHQHQLFRRDDRRPGHRARTASAELVQRPRPARRQDRRSGGHFSEATADDCDGGGRRHGQADHRRQVYSLNQSLGAGIVSGGKTDATGKVVLGLPPGRYAGIRSDPPIESRYIRTNQHPLVVERGEGAQPYEIRQIAGAEVIIQAVGVRASKPVAGAFFWRAPDDQPEETQNIETSTFWSSEPWTDAKGEMRAVFRPEPGRRYRFRFAGFNEPNKPAGTTADGANTQGYAAFPTQSAPVEAERRHDGPAAIHSPQDRVETPPDRRAAHAIVIIS